MHIYFRIRLRPFHFRPYIYFLNKLITIQYLQYSARIDISKFLFILFHSNIHVYLNLDINFNNMDLPH